jgi:hypothetical protein
MTNSNTIETLENELNELQSEIEKAGLEYQAKNRFFRRQKHEIKNQIRLIKGIPEEFKEYFDYMMFSPRDIFNDFLLEARVYNFDSKEELLNFLKEKRKLSNIMTFYSYKVNEFKPLDYFDPSLNEFVKERVEKHHIRFSFIQK